MPKRLSLRLESNPEIVDRLNELKRGKYFDRPWAELYRVILMKGLDVCEKEAREAAKCKD